MLKHSFLAGGLSLALLSAQAQSPAVGTFRYPYYQSSTEVNARTTQVPQLGGYYYTLRDITPGHVPMQTLDCQGNSNWDQALDMIDPNNDNLWLSGDWLQSLGKGRIINRITALDAHWGLQQTLDYWQAAHNWNSFDNLGTRIVNYTNYHNGSIDPDTGLELTQHRNAYWARVNDGTGYYGGIWYEKGNVQGEVEPTDLGTVAHEFGHGVNGSTAQLATASEPGALNEGFSDIWAACVLNYAGFDPWSGPRNPRNPNWSSCPKYYGGDGQFGNDPNLGVAYWNTTDGYNTMDDGLISAYTHTNGTVLLHWFYLLSAGGNGPNEKGENFCVLAQGIDKAARIAFATEKLLTTQSQYLDAYNASLTATTALYGATSAELQAVREAWYAVGVGPKRPTYTISPADWNCSTGTGTFTLVPSTPGLPLPLANWTVSPAGLVTTSATVGTSQISLTQIPGAAGQLSVSAAIVTGCGTQAVPGVQQFLVGNPQPGPIMGEYNAPPGRIRATIDPVPQATSYDWYVNGVLQSGHTTAITFSITRTCSDSYFVEVQAYFGSCGVSQRTYRDFVPNCFREAPTVSAAYPNPANDYLTVGTVAVADEAKTSLRRSAAALSTVTLYNSLGKPVHYVSTTAATERLDVSQLPNGIYTLHINTADGQITRQQVVIQH